MNYEKIYKALCQYCKDVEPMERLKRRNTRDVRLGYEELYLENHHIIPKHDGGDDSDENLVALLPEEHIFAHMVRYKAFRQREDFLAVRFIINGFNSKKYPEIYEQCMINAPINKRVGLFKTMIQRFRTEHGWQSPEGRKKISESRSNTMPCIDANTGEIVGSVPCDHEKVLSGEWVHHSKGRVSVTEISTGSKKWISSKEYFENKDLYEYRGRNQKGASNGNYKAMSAEDKLVLYDLAVATSCEGHFIKKRFESAMKAHFKDRFKRISFVWVSNNFKNIDEFLGLCFQHTGVELKYNPYYRSPEQRLKAKKSGGSWVWVTDGVQNQRINTSDVDVFLEQNNEYKRGRTV